MFAYLLVLLIPLLATLSASIRPSNRLPGFWPYFFLLLFFCGFRYEVGPDWFQYVNIHEADVAATLDELFERREPGYFLLNRLSASLGSGFPGVVFAGSLVFLWGLFAYARTTPAPWAGLVTAIPYLVFIISNSAIRQAIAIGVWFLLLASWRRRSVPARVAFILLAMSFHSSAVVLLLFVVAGLPWRTWLKALMLAVVALATAASVVNSAAVEVYRQAYLTENIVSDGAFLHVMLIAGPGLAYVVFRQRIRRWGLSNDLVMWGSLSSLAILPLLLVSSTGADRLSLYFSFVPVWAYGVLVALPDFRWMKPRAVVALVALAIFLVYFLLGSHAFAYVPYDNLFFQAFLP